LDASKIIEKISAKQHVMQSGRFVEQIIILKNNISDLWPYRIFRENP
jgi:hypothetical protein